jgi:hypothetical protein
MKFGALLADSRVILRAFLENENLGKLLRENIFGKSSRARDRERRVNE